MSPESPEIQTAEETEMPEAAPTDTATDKSRKGGLKEAFMAPINATMNHPVGRVVALAGLLGWSGMIGKDCGRSQAMEDGARIATSYARNCIEAVYGENLGNSRDIMTGYDIETLEEYADLDRLSGFCRQELGIVLSLGQLSLSADKTFPDGAKVKIGDKIRQVPTFTPESLIIMQEQCDEEESSY